MKKGIDVDVNKTLINSTQPDPTAQTKTKKARIKYSFKKLTGLWIFLIVLLFLSGTFYLINYIKNNLTPQAILNKSLEKFMLSGHVGYDTDVKMTFVYAASDEKIDLDGMEVYSLLSRSASDKYEINAFGEHDWKGASPSGKFSLIWKIAEKEVFAVDANYSGHDLNYKIDPYKYSDMIDVDLRENYSKVDLTDLLQRIVSEDTANDLTEINKKDIGFEVTETFPDDIVEGDKSYHYKVKGSMRGGTQKLLSEIDLTDIDVWINKRNLQIVKLKTSFDIKNIGTDGNNMSVIFECKFSF